MMGQLNVRVCEASFCYVQSVSQFFVTFFLFSSLCLSPFFLSSFPTFCGPEFESHLSLVVVYISVISKLLPCVCSVLLSVTCFVRDQSFFVCHFRYLFCQPVLQLHIPDFLPVTEFASESTLCLIVQFCPSGVTKSGPTFTISGGINWPL